LTIKELAQVADFALVMEGARENGDIVSARKGVTDFEVEIIGRAAHAGVEPERGRSAVLEAAHKTVSLHALNGQWPGVTVNVGVLEGGTRPNVIADRARLHIDIRAPHAETLELVESELERICTTHVIPDVEVIVEERKWHRPMEKSEASGKLVELAQAIAGELGFELNDSATGGASDANTTSSAGVPSLDGLGLCGGDAHAESEWIDLTSIVPRVSLLAGLIAGG
jgi:glutamate carboxypeptidase